MLQATILQDNLLMHVIKYHMLSGFFGREEMQNFRPSALGHHTLAI